MDMSQPVPVPTSVPTDELGHPSYAVLRRLAWMFRAERNDDHAAQLEAAVLAVVDYLKITTGAKPADVERAANCLMVDRCGCARCRYGV